MAFTSNDLAIIKFMGHTTAVMSAIASLFTIFTFVYFSDLRKSFSFKLVFYMAVCEIFGSVINVHFLALAILYVYFQTVPIFIYNNAKEGSALCSIQSFCFATFKLASIFYSAIISYCVYQAAIKAKVC
jgi:hypothetical protein